MSPTLERKRRFADVVYAIETSPKTLRNWLQREQVSLVSEKPDEGGWREFSDADIAILAIVKPLVVDFGFEVEDASGLAHKILVFIPGEEWLQQSPTAYTLFWVNRSVLIRRIEDGGDWHVKVQDGWQPHEHLGSAYLTLDIRPILERAFERAASGSEDTGVANEAHLVAGLQKLLIAIKDATPSSSDD